MRAAGVRTETLGTLKPIEELKLLSDSTTLATQQLLNGSPAPSGPALLRFFES
jgi:hypothetical protein